MEPAHSGRFWPLSPRLWRRSNEYSKVVFENRRPINVPVEIKENDDRNSLEKIFPDLIRNKKFRDRGRNSLEPLSVDVETRCHVMNDLNDRQRWSVDAKKPPVVKDTRKADEVQVRMRAKKHREPRPNSLQLLLCPSSSGHYSSNTWRYTRVRSKRYIVF